MEKIIYEGETYYCNKGKLYDSTFIEVPKTVAEVVLPVYYKQIDYHDYSEEQLLKFVSELKAAELYTICLDAITFGLGKFTESNSFCRIVFPIITSCYRAIGTPQKAIDFWFEHRYIFWDCISTALLTSLAAAYCDVGDYDSAKKCADRAYALQDGGKGYSTELSMVYGRIRKESGISGW